MDDVKIIYKMKKNGDRSENRRSEQKAQVTTIDNHPLPETVKTQNFCIARI